MLTIDRQPWWAAAELNFERRSVFEARGSVSFAAKIRIIHAQLHNSPALLELAGDFRALLIYVRILRPVLKIKRSHPKHSGRTTGTPN